MSRVTEAVTIARGGLALGALALVYPAHDWRSAGWLAGGTMAAIATVLAKGGGAGARH